MEALVTVELQLCSDFFFPLGRFYSVEYKINRLLSCRLVCNYTIVVQISDNRKQRKLAAGIVPKKKGRPPKEYVINKETKVSELKYILARKEAKIKSLEMENELMRDFLSLTERK